MNDALDELSGCTHLPLKRSTGKPYASNTTPSDLLPEAGKCLLAEGSHDASVQPVDVTLMAGSIGEVPATRAGDGHEKADLAAKSVDLLAHLLGNPTIRLGSVLFALDGNHELPISPRGMPTRALNVLSRLQLKSWGDLANRTVADLMRPKGAGIGTVRLIVAAAVGKNMEMTEAIERAGTQDLASRASSSKGGNAQGNESAPAGQPVGAPPSTYVAYFMDHSSARIGDVLFRLTHSRELPLSKDELGTRAFNALLRLNCRSWSDVADKTVAELMRIPGVGEETVRQIVANAARAHTESGAIIEALGNGDGHGAGANYMHFALTGHGFYRYMRTLIEWAIEARSATALGDLLALSPELERVPPDLHEGFSVLGYIPLTELIDVGHARIAPNLAIQLLETVEPRTRKVVASRLRTRERPTLEQLGSQLQITRERVRQLEQKGLTVLTAALRDPSCARLNWRALDLAQEIGNAVQIGSQQLDHALKKASSGLADPQDLSCHDLMLWMAGEYRRDSGWLVRGDQSFDGLILALRENLGNRLLIEDADLSLSFKELGIADSELEAIMAATRQWRRLNATTWARWSGDVADKAEVLLLWKNIPVRLEEINRLIGEGHTAGTLRNALARDERFVRTNKDGTFALSAWGLEEYSGIANEMVERIERNGGSVRLSDLIEEFVPKFGVSANSIRMYAETPAFINEKGWVRLRTDHEPYRVDRRIERVPGLYVRPTGEVVVHFVVDRDVLRGAGKRLPEPAAGELGMVPADRRKFVSETGHELVISWLPTATAGPTIGSTKQIAEELELTEGDRFRVIFDASNGRHHAEAANSTDLYGLTGLDIESGQEFTAIASGMRTSPDRVRAHLRSRGEDAVLETLPNYETGRGLSRVVEDFGSLLG